MKFLKRLFADPKVRLVSRALVAGMLAFGAQLETSTSWDSNVLRSALVAGAFGAIEYLTPLNAVVGLGKQATRTWVGAGISTSGSHVVRVVIGDLGPEVVRRPDRTRTLISARLEEHVIRGKRLGRHIEHDERSRNFRVLDSAPPATAVLWDRPGVVLNQGKLGSCTGNAMAGACNTAPLRAARSGRLLTEKNAVDLYELATTLDSISGVYPPDDTGSSGLAVCKAAVKLGYIASYQHAFTIDEALAALKTGPVITGVPWYDGFDTPDVNGVVAISGSVRGGHEFEVLGYDPAADLVTAVNSWGKSWGLAGRFRFTSKTWAQLLAQQGDVTVPLPLKESR